MGISLGAQWSCLIGTVLVGTHSYLTEVLVGVHVDTASLYSSNISVNLWVLSGAASFRQFLVGTHSYLTEVLVGVDTAFLYSSIIWVYHWILSRAASLRQFWWVPIAILQKS